MTPATMKISSTFPAAFASAHSAKSATGSSTNWIQRGTSTRGGPTIAGVTSSRSSRSSCFGGAASGWEPPFTGVDPFSCGGVASEARLVSPIICLPPSPEYG